MPAIRARGGELMRVEGPESIGPIPTELAVLFVVAGIGGVAFCPKLLEAVDRGIRRRFPRAHRVGVSQVNRFIADLERRYP
jgi:hypothetical protein